MYTTYDEEDWNEIEQERTFLPTTPMWWGAAVSFAGESE